MDNNLITISRRSFIQKSTPGSAAAADSKMTRILACESAYSGQEITWEQMMASQLDLMPKTFDDDLMREASPLPVPGEDKLLGMCLTQVGTVWQRFVWLTHWGFRPASSSGTKASRASQGARPTWAAAVVIT